MFEHLPYVFGGGFVMLAAVLGLFAWLKPNAPIAVWIRVGALSAAVSAVICFVAPASAMIVMIWWVFFLIMKAPAYESSAARVGLVLALAISVVPELGLVVIAPKLIFGLWALIYTVGIVSALWRAVKNIRW
jgi:hypothetical protein